MSKWDVLRGLLTCSIAIQAPELLDALVPFDPVAHDAS
jgi:hypothetical protein